MKVRQLMALWKNAVRYEAGGKKSPYYKDSVAVIAAIKNEWLRRKRQPPHLKDYFIWPDTDAPGGDGSLSGHTWEQQGVFGFLGYSVSSDNGVGESMRRRILTHVFEGPLPPLFRPQYLAEWGEPRTSQRLQKMAESLAAFARNAKRRQHRGFSHAVQCWETDLNFLYTEFYVGHFFFEWPSSKVNFL
jgi:hypothetical protein